MDAFRRRCTRMCRIHGRHLFRRRRTTPYSDWCVKPGDYYDAAGNGYHEILCHGEISGWGYYRISHGTRFTIQKM